MAWVSVSFPRTNLEIQPIKTESLNQAQDSFPKESILGQHIDLKHDEHIRIDAVSGFVLK